MIPRTALCANMDETRRVARRSFMSARVWKIRRGNGKVNLRRYNPGYLGVVDGARTLTQTAVRTAPGGADIDDEPAGGELESADEDGRDGDEILQYGGGAHGSLFGLVEVLQLH